MSTSGLAQPVGAAALHRSSPARTGLAVGLLALGIGDLAVIHRVLLPRYLADGPGATGLEAAAGPAAGARIDLVAAPAAAPAAAPVAVAAPAPVAVAAPLPAAAPEVVAAPTPEPPADVPPRPGDAEAAAATAPLPEPFPDLLFALNTTWLSRPSRETLDRVAAALAAEPSRRVILSGHADAAGPSELNRELARARARRAGRYLRDRGVEASRVELRSFGSERPAEDTGPGSLRKRNRRVEIALD